MMCEPTVRHASARLERGERGGRDGAAAAPIERRMHPLVIDTERLAHARDERVHVAPQSLFALRMRERFRLARWHERRPCG